MTDNTEKINRLEKEIEGYQKKLKQMETDWAASRGGSRYGDEYLETQVKVYQSMIVDTKKEIMDLKRQKK